MNLILDLLMDPSSDGVALRYHVSPVSPRLGEVLDLLEIRSGMHPSV
jgi:hypothetical protein